MNFCSECNNILYPKDVNNKLVYFCKNCRQEEISDVPLVFREVISGGQSTQTKRRNNNIILDPALPRKRGLICPQPNCGTPDPVYYQTTEESMSLTYVCTNRSCIFMGTLEDFHVAQQ